MRQAYQQDTGVQAHRRTGSRERGFILITVLVLLVLLTTVLLGGYRLGRRSLAMSDQRPDRLQARLNGLSGCEIAAAALAADPQLLQNPDRAPQDRWRLELGRGHCEVRIWDESGKIQINGLKNTAGQLDRWRVQQLLRLADRLNQAAGRPVVSYAMAPCLIDWVDTDQDPTVLEWVATDNRGWDPIGTDTNYPCGNRPLLSIDELGRVKNFPQDSADLERLPSKWPFEGWASVLTVYDCGKLNVNAAGPWVLGTLLEGLTDSQVEQILTARKERPFESLEAFRTAGRIPADAFAAVAPRLTVTSQYAIYRIESTGIAGDQAATVKMVIKVKPADGGVSILEYNEQ